MNQGFPAPPPPVWAQASGPQTATATATATTAQADMNYPTMAMRTSFPGVSPFGFGGSAHHQHAHQSMPAYSPFFRAPGPLPQPVILSQDPRAPAAVSQTYHHQQHPTPTAHHVPQPADQPRSPPQPQQTFTCEPCGKTFPQDSQYQAHLGQHVQCHHPGCSFSAVRKVVTSHHGSAHGSLPESKSRGAKDDKWLAHPKVPSLNTPEEIERWRAERRKRWPSNAVVAQKEEEKKRRAEEMAQKHGGNKKRKTAENKSAMSLVAAYNSEGEATSEEEPTEEAIERGADGEAAEQAQSGPGGNGEQKRKTRICKYFLQRRCRHGQNCRFSHERPQRNSKQQNKQNQPQKTTLLRKLLANDIRKEHLELLQCIRFIVNHNFFDSA